MIKRFCFLKLLLLTLVSFQCLTTAQTTGQQSIWSLQDYNEWNLPFAKEVYLEHNPQGNFTTYFYLQNYMLKVDASAIFSILWQQKMPPTVSEDDLIELDYGYYGNEAYKARGVWSSARMNITDTDSEEHAKQFSINVTIFIAYGKSPETGLDGLLALG